jgi:hypothetical protein
MKKNIIYIAILLIIGVIACTETTTNQGESQEVEQTAAVDYNYPSYCEYFPAPAGTDDAFMLSQNYPQTFDDANFKQPWKKIDFKKDYKAYMQSLLDYCMEGNVAVDFKCQDNSVRKWYNAPWLDNDGNDPATSTNQNSGREYHHGLTREITIKAGTLGEKQVNNYQTWAVAYYNEPGGFTMGKVWEDANSPDRDLADFPEGTVCFKLLLTETPVKEAPYLENSLEWTANIFVPYNEVKERFDETVRLVQLDVSVKDDRAETGWIYGTFTHDAALGGAKEDWVSRLVPVGMMWGDDSNDTTMLNITDRFNPSLQQSAINQDLLLSNGQKRKPNAAFVTHLGQGGRMNGPVDNPISSCMSCHGRAAIDEDGDLASIANFGASSYTLADFNEYFSQINCGIHEIKQPQTDGTMKAYRTLDFSFQIANGLRNYYHVEQPLKARGGEQEFKKIILRDGTEISLK